MKIIAVIVLSLLSSRLLADFELYDSIKDRLGHISSLEDSIDDDIIEKMFLFEEAEDKETFLKRFASKRAKSNHQMLKSVDNVLNTAISNRYLAIQIYPDTDSIKQLMSSTKFNLTFWFWQAGGNAIYLNFEVRIDHSSNSYRILNESYTEEVF